ncbi:selenium metabolism-associated LysR family transcriptional regulator [Desulfovibrionales bacterium]
MDIRKIQAFAKVYEHASFSKAGKALYLSQPTISAHVASLEQELGLALFDRIGRTVVPTKAGEILYSHALRIFDAADLALSELHTLQDRVTGHLDIGGSTIPANFILPEFLAHFSQEFPEVILDLHVGDSEEIITAVRDNVLMLGVVGAVLDSAELVYEPILQDRLVLVMTPGLYRRFSCSDTAELLRSLPWVMREEGSGTRLAMITGLARLGIDVRDLKSVITVRNAGVMSRCIQAEMGAGITSASTVQSLLEKGLLVAVTVPNLCLERHFYIVYNKRRTLFPAALRLIDFLKRHAGPHRA